MQYVRAGVRKYLPWSVADHCSNIVFGLWAKACFNKLATRIYQKGRWQRHRHAPPEPGARIFCQQGELNTHTLPEILQSRTFDAIELDPEIGNGTRGLQMIKLGNFLKARRTPFGPVVHQHPLPPVTVPADRDAIGPRQFRFFTTGQENRNDRDGQHAPTQALYNRDQSWNGQVPRVLQGISSC